MISRTEAVKIVNDHFDKGYQDECPAKKYSKAGLKGPWHYGRMELKALLDAIYGQPDTSNLDELIKAK